MPLLRHHIVMHNNGHMTSSSNSHVGNMWRCFEYKHYMNVHMHIQMHMHMRIHYQISHLVKMMDLDASLTPIPQNWRTGSNHRP